MGNDKGHMTEAELIFTALAELSTRQIAEQDKADGFQENAESAHQGGAIAGHARKQLEQKTGKKIVSKENFLSAPKLRQSLPKPDRA